MRRSVCLIVILLSSAGVAARAALPTTRPTNLRLTIDADDPQQAALQVGRLMGRRVMIGGNVGAVHYHGEDLPYAQAVTQFLEKTGLTFDPSSDFGLVGGAPLSVVRLGDTAALVITRATLSAQQMLLNPQPPSYTCTLDGVLILDPALRVLGVMPSVRADRVDLPTVTNRDTGPVFDGGFGLVRALNDSSAAMRVSVSFVSTAPVDRVPMVAGRVRAWQVAEAAEAAVSFDQIADGGPVEGSGVTAAVSIDDANGGPAGLRVKLTGPAAELYRDPRWQQALRRSVTALDIEGGPLAIEPYFTGGPRPAAAAGGGVELRLRPSGRASDFFDQLTSVRVRVPTKLRVIDLPFEIRDLDLSPKTGPVSATGAK